MGHVATTPNRAQPPLTESSGSRHGSPVFHLSSVNKRGNIVTTETRVDRIQPCFLAHGVVDLLALGNMLRRAHRLQLRARVRIGVHYIKRRVGMRILRDGVVGTRTWWLHIVIRVLRRPRIVGVMLVVEGWRGLRRRGCGASVWRRERRQCATRRNRSLLVMIYGPEVVQLRLVVCGSRRRLWLWGMRPRHRFITSPGAVRRRR
jgi:hypothetical protein